MSATMESALSVRIQQEISTLEVQASRITVQDRGSYQDACQFVLQGRARIKAVGRELDPGISKAKDVVEVAREALYLLKLQKDKWVNLYAAPIAIVENRAAAWMAEDNRQRQIEQDRINAQARLDAQQVAAEEKRIADAQAEADRKERQKEIDKQRAAGEIKARVHAQMKKDADERFVYEKKMNEEQAAKTAAEAKTVRVESGVPVVAGIRRSRNWKFRVINPALVPLTYRMIDEVAIGQMVRATKDKAGAEKQCAGIEVWSEEGV
jgi:hypothetical protein